MVGSKRKHCWGHGLKIMLRTSSLMDEPSFLPDLPKAFIPFLRHFLGPALGCSYLYIDLVPLLGCRTVSGWDPGMLQTAEVHRLSMEMHTSDGVHPYSVPLRLFLKIWL